ncbi:MAG: hypothetical protein ACKO43_00040 [Alphaproteobacteria bacterium]
MSIFAVYHNHKNQLVAIKVGKESSETITRAIASNGCGLDGQMGNYYGVEAESPEHAISVYQDLQAQSASKFMGDTKAYSS